MKVAIISNYWKNSDAGGMSKNVINFVEELKTRDRIQLYLIYKEGKDNEFIHIDAPKPLFIILAFLALLRIKPDVINSRENWYCLLPGYLYKKLRPVKLIHTYHTYPGSDMGLFGKVFYRYVLNFQKIIDHCDCVTFVSEGMIGQIEKVRGIGFKKTAITYAGVEPVKVDPVDLEAFRTRYNIKQGSIVLLANGLTQLRCKAEGAKILMQAVCRLKPKYPGLVLILTREGIYSNELAEYARKLSLGDSVVFTGTLRNPEIPLAICDIYTHISLCDGVPIAVVEAMYMQKPIVATNIGGIPEAIKNLYNGVLVEPDPDEISEKIEYLLKNKGLTEEYGKNAKATAEDKFSRRRSVDKFIEVYTTC